MQVRPRLIDEAQYSEQTPEPPDLRRGHPPLATTDEVPKDGRRELRRPARQCLHRLHRQAVRPPHRSPAHRFGPPQIHLGFQMG